jgi:hypothetical protein
LLQYGFALPLAVDIDSRGDKVLGRAVGFIEASGSDVASVADEVEGFQFQLSLDRETDDRVLVSLREGEQGRLIFSESVALEATGPRRQAAALARIVLEQIYTVRR